MADASTPVLGLIKPDVGASDDTWGEKLNGNFDILDSAFGSSPDGDVIGPNVAGANNVVLFNGSSGKIIKDSGYTAAGLSNVIDHNALVNYVASEHFGDAPNDGKQYVRKNNGWLEAAIGGGGIINNYQYNATTSAPPASGSLRFNSTTMTSITTIWLNYTNFDSIDLKNYFLQKVTIGDTFYVQDRDDSAKWQLFRLDAAYTDNGTYATMPVTRLSGGNALTAARVIVVRESASVSNPVTEAPVDSTTYGRENNTWVRIPTITVGTTAPSSPAVNDVWIDTN